MVSPDYYRNQAKCCLRLARETSDAAVARRLSALAADFMQSALEVEGHDPSGIPPILHPPTSDGAGNHE